jgi:hypothetical protein
MNQHGINGARFLSQATEAALAGDYHKATALTGIAITHLMVAATPEPSDEPAAETFGVKVERYPGFTTDGTDPEEPVTINGFPVSYYTSDIPYRQYDTVLGYLAKHYPERLELIDQVPDATMRDGWALKHHCARVGQPVYKVKAPLFLQDEGIEEVNAYPIEILAHRFGEPEAAAA